MSISGGQIKPAGAGGEDGSVSDEMRQAQIADSEKLEDSARLIKSKTDRIIDPDNISRWNIDYLRMMRRFGLDGSRGFASAFHRFAEGLKTDPIDLRAAFLTDVEDHLRSNLIAGYNDLASSSMRSGKLNLAAMAHRAVAIAVTNPYSKELEFFQQILNLINSSILSIQQYGERSLAAMPFGNDGSLLKSSILNTFMRLGVPEREDVELWRKLIRSGIGEIIRVPEIIPHQTNAYVPLAQEQITRLSGSFSEATDGDKTLPFGNSLRALFDREEVSPLVRDFLGTLSVLEKNRISKNVYALIHITAAHENLTPERVALTGSVLGLIRAAAPITAVKLRYYIVPLAIAYLGSNKPNAQVEKNLTRLLNELLKPADRPSEDETKGSVARLFNIDGVSDVANASDIDVLVYNVLNNLVHHRDPARTEAARLLDLADLAMEKKNLNGAWIVLISSALYQDMLRGTEEFSQMKLDKYMKILFDTNPEVKELIDNARLSFNSDNDGLFARYEEIKLKRRRGSGGPVGGGASGTAPQRSPKAGGSSGGTLKDASSVDSTEGITDEYVIDGSNTYSYDLDAEGWGAEGIDVTGMEDHSWVGAVPPIKTGAIVYVGVLSL